VTERTRELRAILDNAPVLAFRLEPDGSFSNWEGRGLDRLPLSPAERESLTLEQLGNENAAENCRRALDGETFQDTVELGGHYWETWYQPIHEGGEVTGAICFALDVSDDRRRAQVVEVLGRVLRHNLRNSMNIVVGEAARMQVEAEDATVVEAAERITRSGEDLLDVADAARDIQRVVVDDRRFDPVDAAAVVRSTCEELGDRYPGADLSVDLDGASGAHVPDTGFDVAVHELVENALEHAGSVDPTVEVTLTTPEPETVRVRVADDGPGLPEMERGVLEAGGEEPLRHGQGLGLWLINWVVDETGGEMAIDSEPGAGTTVTVDLPRVEDHPMSDADRVAADADD
jgi:signal transduction histidine kinase